MNVRYLHSFGGLRSVERYFITDISGQSVGPFIKGQAYRSLQTSMIISQCTCLPGPQDVRNRKVVYLHQHMCLTLDDGPDRFIRLCGLIGTKKFRQTPFASFPE